jgi:large subunit ribosomal protein L24
MKKFKIKKNDKVIVLSGKDKGKSGVVLKVLRERDRVLVSEVNMVKKHTRATQAEPATIVSKEASLHISNVALICPKTNKATKVGYKFLEDGLKVRVARKSGEVIEN